MKATRVGVHAHRPTGDRYPCPVCGVVRKARDRYALCRDCREITREDTP